MLYRVMLLKSFAYHIEFMQLFYPNYYRLIIIIGSGLDGESISKNRCVYERLISLLFNSSSSNMLLAYTLKKVSSFTQCPTTKSRLFRILKFYT